MTEDQYIELAVDMYGQCIGSGKCLDICISKLVEEYGLTSKYAEHIAEEAFECWIEAYTYPRVVAKVLKQLDVKNQVEAYS